MSLLLVQGYESPEEEVQKFFSDSDEEDAGHSEPEDKAPTIVKPTFSQQTGPQPRTSILPTAYEMFTEVTGPPDFLKHSMVSRSQGDSLPSSKTPNDFTQRYVAPKEHKERRPPAAAAVVQARAQVEQESDKTAVEAKRRAPGAGLPPAEDAASLLRMCLSCGVPKTFSGAKEGMVCPLCGDRPVVAGPNAAADKKRGNKVKDKEHQKRMKGQSAHSTWKSETEMSLRQQFD